MLDQIQRQFSKSQVIDLQQGLALLPLIDELYDAISNGENADLIHEDFMFLSPKIIDLIIEYSKQQPVGYFETDYFGGAGIQKAILAKEGKIAFEPQEGSHSINAILKLMAIQIGKAHDEFDAIGLGRFRDNEDWIKQPDFGRQLRVVSEPKSFFSQFLRLLKK